MLRGVPDLVARDCPLCGGREHKELFRATDVNSRVTDEEFTIVRCACRMVFLNPVPRDLGRYYPAAYDPHRDRGGAPKKLRKGSHRFDRLAGMKPGRLLDVGCGSGYDLAAMREKGWEAAGVEMNAQAAAHARAQGLDVRQGTLLDARLGEGSFDVVTLFHVLEHLVNVREVVSEVARVLKPGGVMLAQVPNVEGANAKLFREHWYELDVPRHVNFFSPATLKALVSKELPVASLRWIESSADFRRSLKNKYGRTFGAKVARPLLRVTYTVLNLWRTGDMLEVLARRPPS
jgi:2-polyprenyl-3-methyl-5-hydroxy-6-metoxy-1,4-benzoquinol methylase